MEIKIDNLEEVPKAARALLDMIQPKGVYAFDGAMGNGKTTLIVELLKQLGIVDPEGSPTYSLVNSYQTERLGAVFHFDFYRITEEDEAYDIGVEEMFFGGGTCLIEWPERIKNLLPDGTIWINLRKNEDETRTLTVDL